MRSAGPAYYTVYWSSQPYKSRVTLLRLAAIASACLAHSYIGLRFVLTTLYRHVLVLQQLALA